MEPLLLAALGGGALLALSGLGGGSDGRGDLNIDLGADPDEPPAGKGADMDGNTILPRAGEPLPPVAEGDAMDVADWHRDMDDYFASQGVSDVATAALVTYLPKATEIDYAIPDPAYWGNMAYTLGVLRDTGLVLGEDVEVRGYRPPWYNKAVGGSAGSTHQYFSAVDLWPKKVRVSRLHDEAKRLWADRHTHETGIGMYGNNIHVDTRRGRPARWGSKKSLLG